MKRKNCMKRKYMFMALLCYALTTAAQDASHNYVRTRSMLDETGGKYLDKVEYFDGLGRPFQTVLKKVTASNSNLVTLQEYDVAGRAANSWLPIVSSAEYVAPAAFKSSAPGNYSNDSRPYSQPVYEASSLNRTVKEYGPGAAWYSGHSVNTDYLANSTANAQLNCINYSVSSAGALTSNGSYASGQLSVVKTTDEDLNVSYTFTDKMGHVVLSRQMKGSETHDTYYVYDDKSNLCFVLQPMYQSSANLDLYAFQYKYDGLNRCIWKKLPGAGYVEMVYDNADRLVFSQDGNQRALTSGNWTYYKYDSLNRLTEQGVCTNKVTTSGTTVHIRNYYDSYSFVGTQGFPASNFSNDTSGYSRGLLTGQMVAGLGSSGPVWKAFYYDIRRREVKRVESNEMSGYDVTTTAYSFTDKPLTVTHTQSAGSTSSTSLTEVTTYAYDSADRLQKVQHKLGSGPTVTLAEYGYDNFGRLNSKKLGGALHTSTYAYNLRSWLTGISGSKFSQTLNYNNGSAGYNGNITAMDWTANGSSHRYTFSYDGLNRLTSATHGAGRYTEKVTGYDKNGNILSLQRYGQTSASAYGLIDNLTFTLAGNRPTRVDDAVAASAYNGGSEFKDGVKQANEYVYDANGNLTKDLNKGISGIQYNVLNLPTSVTFSSGGFIQYGYTADGIKRRMMYKEANGSGNPVPTVYCCNVVYENGVAKLLLTEAGYVTLSDKKYHYYLQDHQGNNRVVLSSTGAVEEASHYYPFGGVFASSGNVQPYKYNGKEYDGKKGLNWYDYGARMYDAALGRFTTVDPSAENYFNTSLYAYCGNNSINRIDPDGMDYWSTNNPEVIRQFLETAKEHSNASGNLLNEVNFSSWNHSTDAEFLSNLTFNDQTNMFYSNYGAVENGVVTSIGVSFPALGNNGESAWLEGGKGRWYRQASGKLDNTYPEFMLSTSVTKAGWGTLRWIWNSLNPTFSPINTINANAVKDIAVKGFKETKKFGYSHGEKVYEYKGKYYSKDVDSHNGGAWKVFKEVNGKLVRIGTADKELNIFKK